jgi:hypothetical protein
MAEKKAPNKALLIIPPDGMNVNRPYRSSSGRGAPIPKPWA